METVNKKIAVTPFETTDTTVVVKNMIPHLKQRTELTRLQVQFMSLGDDLETPRYMPGDYVYVRGDLCKHQLAREIFEVEGKSFILIDEAMVIGYDVKDCENPDGN